MIYVLFPSGWYRKATCWVEISGRDKHGINVFLVVIYDYPSCIGDCSNICIIGVHWLCYYAGKAGTDFVESRPWRVRSGCLQRSSAVSRGMVDKYPLRTAHRRVDCTGLPNDAFVSSTNFLSEGREITAFACSSERWIGNVQAVAAVVLGLKWTKSSSWYMYKPFLWKVAE